MTPRLVGAHPDLTTANSCNSVAGSASEPGPAASAGCSDASGGRSDPEKEGVCEGGLDGELRRTIRRPASAPVATALTPGTRLTREWQGVRHEVQRGTAAAAALAEAMFFLLL